MMPNPRPGRSTSADDKTKKKKKRSVLRIGAIDLGTCNSALAYYKRRSPRIVKNSRNLSTTPSVVAFLGDGLTLCGQAAVDQLCRFPRPMVVYEFKRLIGGKFTDECVQAELGRLLYSFKGNTDGDIVVVVKEGDEEEVMRPEQISAMLLSQLWDDFKLVAGPDVKDVVITVPAHFNHRQRQATKQGVEIAGLNVVRMINEPTAAALAFGQFLGWCVEDEEEEEEAEEDEGDEGEEDATRAQTYTPLVFDLGGGTFDVSILTVTKGSYQVLWTLGDTHLGGADFTNVLMMDSVRLHREATGFDMCDDDAVMHAMRLAHEKAKCALEKAPYADIRVALPGGGDYGRRVSRAAFDDLVAPLVAKCAALVEKCVHAAGLRMVDITDVLLVGGSSRLLSVRAMLTALFGDILRSNVSPDEAVALGAACLAGLLAGDDVPGIKLLHDVTSQPLGIATYVEATNVEASRNNVMDVMIKAGVQTPCHATRNYSTQKENQTVQTFKLYEGAAKSVLDCTFLGSFDIQLPPGPPEQYITVRVDVDCNGIIKVTAVHEDSGNRAEVVIDKGASGLSPDDINGMTEILFMQNAATQRKTAKDEAKNRLEARMLSERGRLVGGAPADMAAACDVAEQYLAGEDCEDDDASEVDRKLEEIFNKKR